MPTIHQRAAQLIRESHGRLNLHEAYVELSRRAHASRRWRNHGVLHVTNTDRAQFSAVESPRYAWQDRADLQ